MKEQNDSMIELLRFNKGFTHPEKWVEYGISHNFKKTAAAKLEECPDCGARSLKSIGQFVYYSTLANLMECTHCKLVFSDTRIDPDLIRAHFERAYKDEEYFVNRRHRIFKQISKLADRFAPQGGNILDVGGAKGHLLVALKKRRKDINPVLNDLSREACSYAEQKYGFQTILGGINELEHISSRFDVIILGDVIYYEPELRRLWAVLPRLLSENGTVIIRVPNKHALILFWQFLRRAFSRAEDNEMQDNIRFFNPEHLFVFSRRYLLMRLKSIGLHKVIAIPSELLNKHRSDLLHPFVYYVCKVISIISFGKLIYTPGILVIAQKKVPEEENSA